MEAKKILSPLVLALLFGLFTLVGFMVWLTRGKRSFWLARKMKLGAAILTLAGISTGCPPVVTCYDPMPMNWFDFDQLDYEQNAIVADLPADSVLTGTLRQPTYDAFSFTITDADSTVLQQGNVLPADGQYDTDTEPFTLALNSRLDTGMYILRVQGIEETGQDAGYPVAEQRLLIQ
ncbi:MAG TPA: hypothetical protein PLK12_08115 [Prolixibacteraceae bacterium]|nr:hypothetical protein [Prolixibacteraceae bacterium]